jgi:choline kinase
MDSDIIFDQRIIKLLLESGPGNCLAFRSDPLLAEEEMKVMVEDGTKVSKISKKIDPQLAAGESIGIEKFEPEFIKILFEKLDQRIVSRGRVNDFYEAAFQDAIDDGQILYALDVGELKCIEIDTTEDIEHAEELVVKYIDDN